MQFLRDEIWFELLHVANNELYFGFFNRTKDGEFQQMSFKAGATLLIKLNMEARKVFKNDR